MGSQNRSLKTDKTFSQDLTAGALSYTSDYSRRGKIESVSVKATVNITETITVTLKSKNGSAYDIVLAEFDMLAERDFMFRPQGELNLQDGDEILVECTQANVTGTVSGSIKASEMLK